MRLFQQIPKNYQDDFPVVFCPFCGKRMLHHQGYGRCPEGYYCVYCDPDEMYDLNGNKIDWKKQ